MQELISMIGRRGTVTIGDNWIIPVIVVDVKKVFGTEKLQVAVTFNPEQAYHWINRDSFKETV